MTFGLVKGSYFGRQFIFRPDQASKYIVSRSQTLVKVVWLHKTSFHHCCAHSSKIARAFDRESSHSANGYSHLSTLRVTHSFAHDQPRE